MKTIKDILKADNYEQRRRIANNLAISREDKNALIANESNGGGDNEELVYYKTNRSQVNLQSMQIMAIVPVVKFIATSPDNIDGEEIFVPQLLLLNGYGDGRYLAGFAISKKSIYTVFEGLRCLTSGTIEERTNDIINYAITNKLISNEDAPAIKEQMLVPFNEYCTQCTKEEYESLITIKPE